MYLLENALQPITRKEFENAGLSSSCGRKQFWKYDGVTIMIMWLHWPNFLKRESRIWPAIVEFLNSCVDGKHLMKFFNETAVFKFHRCSVVDVRVASITVLCVTLSASRYTQKLTQSA